MDWEKLEREWLNSLAYGIGCKVNAKTTVYNKQQALKSFIKKTESKASVDIFNANSLKQAMLSPAITYNSKEQMFKAVVSVMRLLADKELITELELQKALRLTPKRPADYKIRRKTAKPSELKALLDFNQAFRQPRHQHETDRADLCLKLAAYLGQRRAEVISLNRSGFCQETQSLTFIGKGNKARRVPLVEPVRSALNAYIDQWHKGKGWHRDGVIIRSNDFTPYNIEAFGTSFGRLFRAFYKETGIDLNFHGLRHFFVTESLKNGVPLEIVSKFVGHANTLVTQAVYSHLTIDDNYNLIKKWY